MPYWQYISDRAGSTQPNLYYVHAQRHPGLLKPPLPAPPLPLSPLPLLRLLSLLQLQVPAATASSDRSPLRVGASLASWCVVLRCLCARCAGHQWRVELGSTPSLSKEDILGPFEIPCGAQRGRNGPRGGPEQPPTSACHADRYEQRGTFVAEEG